MFEQACVRPISLTLIWPGAISRLEKITRGVSLRDCVLFIYMYRFKKKNNSEKTGFRKYYSSSSRRHGDFKNEKLIFYTLHRAATAAPYVFIPRHNYKTFNPH